MATALTLKLVGAPDNSFQWYLHSGGVALSTGFPVALGDGTETKLWLDGDGVGFINAGGFNTSFRCSATAHQTLTFHYTAGAGKVHPELIAVLAANATSTSVTPATVASFSTTLAASTVYEFEMILLMGSAATTVSPRITINGPSSQVDTLWFEITGPPTVTTLLTNGGTRASQQFTAFGSQFTNATDLPATGTPYAFRVKGILKTTGVAPAVPVTIDLASETAGTQVTLYAASMQRFKPIG